MWRLGVIDSLVSDKLHTGRLPVLFFVCIVIHPAPNNGSQSSPSGFDVGSVSIGSVPPATGQGIMIQPPMNQTGVAGGVQAPLPAVGGMPRPLLPPQPNAIGSMSMNNAQLPSNTLPGAAATAPNNARMPGPAVNAGMQTQQQQQQQQQPQQQQQQQQAPGARNIRGPITDGASNLESIVSRLAEAQFIS